MSSFRQLISTAARFIQQQLRTALRNTQSQNTQTKRQQQAEQVDQAAWKSGMKVDEAASILNLDKMSQAQLDAVNERFNTLFKRNDVARGGSFYLQSKVYVAKTTLEEAILTGKLKGAGGSGGEKSAASKQ